jgi:hypothetical protein
MTPYDARETVRLTSTENEERHPRSHSGVQRTDALSSQDSVSPLVILMTFMQQLLPLRENSCSSSFCFHASTLLTKINARTP